MERSTMLFMGKSTISTGPFSIAICMFTRGYPKISEVWDDTLKFQWNDHWIPQKSWEYSGIDPTKNCLTLMINRFRYCLVDSSENQWILGLNHPSILFDERPSSTIPALGLTMAQNSCIQKLDRYPQSWMGETDAIWATYDLSEVWNTRDFWDDSPYTSHGQYSLYGWWSSHP